MSSANAPPVLIAGAGPAGLVLALSLSINGIPVRVVEKELSHRVGSKGTRIMPKSLEIYRFLGVLDDIQSSARGIVPVRLYNPKTQEVIKEWYMSPIREPTPTFPYLTPCSLDQSNVEGILRDHLARRFNVIVELGTELIHFEQTKDQVLVQLRKTVADGSTSDEETVVQYLIGTDGGRSTVRKALGLTFDGETAKEVIIYGDVVLKGLDEHHWHMFGAVDSKMVLIRRPSSHHSDCFSIQAGGRDIVDPDALAADTNAMEQYIKEVTNRPDLEFVKWEYLTSHRPNTRMVNHFSNGRVFVAGDAAHTHSPTGGQGLNSSIQDSFNLGWKLALVLKGLAKPSLLESYSEERKPVIEEMLRVTKAILNEVSTGERNKNLDADIGAWQRGVALAMLGVNYEWSSIVYDERREGGRAATAEGAYSGGAKGVRAGDRAPHAPNLEVLTSAEFPKLPLSLFDTFTPDKHTLLLFATDDASPGSVTRFLDTVQRQPAGSIRTVLVFATSPPELGSWALQHADNIVVDHDGHAFKAYGIDEMKASVCAVVVRPDAMVGAVVTNAEGLERYFSLIFTSF